MDVSRRFEEAIIIGLPAFVDKLLSDLPEAKKPLKVHRFDHWPNELPSGCDLIISGLVLQSRNDVPELVIAAHTALKPDGLFLSVIIGGESLVNLRRAWFGADQSRIGGVKARMAPMINMQQAAGLLSMAGFAQPVIDRDKTNISYRTLKTLVDDLRDIGETNCLATASIEYEGRGFIKVLESHYPEKDSKSKYIARFEFIWMAGWSPHDSQQKPLKPGSAKMKLSDALKKIREN